MKKALGVAILVLVGFSIGWILKSETTPTGDKLFKQVRENSGTYKFINPILYTENYKESTEYKPLEEKIQNYIDEAQSDKLADSVSVYFRDLNSGNWTGVNEDVLYEPSSMLKVLVMLSYLRKDEDDHQSLYETLNYQNMDDPGQTYKPTRKLATGPQTVNDLLAQMIDESDNQAALTLLNNNMDGFNRAYSSLQLPQPPVGKLIDYMSPESYSVLFRTLYNSSYITREDSEKALRLLSMTSFTKGIVAGVPENTQVSHKFGEHTERNSDGTLLYRELHDCGIVYKPSDPYFICIMTKGTDFSKLETVIQSISKIIYDNVIKL